jgi:hypothetical protein
MPTEQQIKETKWHWIGKTLREPQGAVERYALDCNTQGTRTRGRYRKQKKNRRMGTAEGRRKLERGKTISFR